MKNHVRLIFSEDLHNLDYIKIKDIYTDRNVTKEEMMQESELNGYSFPILTD